jgi:hypothetical protein
MVWIRTGLLMIGFIPICILSKQKTTQRAARGAPLFGVEGLDKTDLLLIVLGTLLLLFGAIEY